MRMTTQQVLYERAASIFHEPKPSPFAVGGMEQCLVCGNIAEWISNAHAVKHGYKNRKTMIEDGKIMSRANHKLVRMRR